ncbi:hypothetical protein L9F63_024001, partial [Diploptera punctata]
IATPLMIVASNSYVPASNPLMDLDSNSYVRAPSFTFFPLSASTALTLHTHSSWRSPDVLRRSPDAFDDPLMLFDEVILCVAICELGSIVPVQRAFRRQFGIDTPKDKIIVDE